MNVLLSDVDNIFGYIYRGIVGNQYSNDIMVQYFENLRESLFLI